ncbi:hypothetical protein TEA_022524 [Camellia sinensis var. sinensis]|uniref:ACB domain-containing protein n=1 Tax=Camellia sinensis var. sinensis TaxID=542762 RepID=A0A4S4DUX9_CAMSN|nr:hypothetical protein TEA_022524 [Camellia sinensis var. sinensis]
MKNEEGRMRKTACGRSVELVQGVYTNEEWSNFGALEEFEEYAETLPESTTNESKLILYGLYKQATVGPVNTSRPGMFNMRDRAKWDAWKAVEGKSKDEAMSDYITKVKQLLEEATASA